MKTIGLLFLCMHTLVFWLTVLDTDHKPGAIPQSQTPAIISVDNKSSRNAGEPGKSSVTLNGVVYPFDDPPYSGGTLQDEHKFEQTMVNGKPAYKDVKTGKRTLLFIFNDRKNEHNLTVTIYFDGKAGDSNTLSDSGNRWAGKFLRGTSKGKLNITSLKKIEAYKYLMSGTFEKEVDGKSGKYHFNGRFKDFVVTDLEDPAIQRMINKQTPPAMKKAADEMRRDAQKSKG